MPQARWPKTTDFETWQDAFAACREQNRPLAAKVGDERATVFPSGTAIDILPHPACIVSDREPCRGFDLDGCAPCPPCAARLSEEARRA